MAGDGAEARLCVAADRFEDLIARMEATARRECDCSLPPKWATVDR